MLVILVSCADTGGDLGDNSETPTGPESDELVDITALGYTLVYDPFQFGEQAAAEELIDKIEEKTGTRLAMIEQKGMPEAEYEIWFGTLSARSDSKKALNALKSYIAQNVSVYTIQFHGDDLIVTASDSKTLKLASEKLLSYLNDSKLKIAPDIYESYIVVNSDGKTVQYSVDDFKSNTMLLSLSYGEETINVFSENEKSFKAYYPSVSDYPAVSAVSLNKNSNVEIIQAKDNSGMAEIKVKSENGESEEIYSVEFSYAELIDISAAVVNKDGASGVVTFVFDDGNQKSADLLVSRFMQKYPSLKFNFAIITQQLATLELAEDGESWRVDANGDYILNFVPNKYSTAYSDSILKGESYQYVHEFWARLADVKGIELLSHSHTHRYWGEHDGPSDDFPAGNITKELKASQQILRNLCREEAICYVKPGVEGLKDTSVYFNMLENSGLYIGARATKTTPWDFRSMVNYAKNFSPDSSKRNERFYVSSYAVTHYATRFNLNTEDPNDYTTNIESSAQDCINAGAALWIEYVSTAIESGGWASFCFHNVIEDNETSTSKWFVYESQADALFKYAQNQSEAGKLWIASYTEAQLYYNQWSTAKVNARLSSDKSITVSVTDNEPDSVYNMPLTVKVPVPMNWNTAASNGQLLTVHTENDGSKYVYLNIVPDSGDVSITEN